MHIPTGLSAAKLDLPLRGALYKLRALQAVIPWDGKGKMPAEFKDKVLIILQTIDPPSVYAAVPKAPKQE